MPGIALKLEGVCKVYRLYTDRADRLKEALHPFGKKYHKRFYAVKDVSLEVRKGEILGIIGRNGSGKSSLLKMIAGVLQPASGSISTNGTVTALLELGAGFNPEFTGRENIDFYCTILGLDREKIREITQPIIEFAELGAFIDQPLKTYSSGMKSRLGFAVASQVDSDILILDEVLAVGDEMFVKKCYSVIRNFIQQDKTILLVSHSAKSISDFCTRAILLDGGKLVYEGEPVDTLREYRKILYGSQPMDSDNFEKVVNEQRYDPGITATPIVDIDKGDFELEDVSFSCDGQEVNVVQFDDEVSVTLTLTSRDAISWNDYHTGMTIVTQTGFRLAALKFSSISSAGNKHVLKAGFECSLNSGLYSIIFSVTEKATRDYLIFVNDVHVFRVMPSDLNPFARWAQLEVKGRK